MKKVVRKTKDEPSAKITAKPASDWHPGLFGEGRRTWLIALGSLAAVLVVAVICVQIAGASRTDRAARAYEEFISQYDPTAYAAQFTNQLVDAPVDFKTGDIYLPEAKLRLDRPERMVSLAYTYSAPGASRVATAVGRSGETRLVEQLKVIDQRVLNKVVAAAKNVTDEDKLREQNHLTRCGQGVSVVFDSDSRPALYDVRLHKLVRLSNGKTMYIYFDKLCPEFRQTAELLSKLQPY